LATKQTHGRRDECSSLRRAALVVRLPPGGPCCALRQPRRQAESARGARYFGCRLCHDLTYSSRQASHKDDRVWRMLAEGTGYDPATVRQVLNRIGKPERTKRRRRG
jgi:hypothetical protein